jgi:hypothetical protein
MTRIPMFVVSSLRAHSLLLAVLPALLVATPGSAAAEDVSTEGDPFVSLPCPIEGQEGAIVLGRGGGFQAACLALSRPHDPGPWTGDDTERVDGSSQFCPRPVLSVLDESGAVTIRFLPAAPESFLADPAACCRASVIAADPWDGRVRVATGGPGRDCFGGADGDAYEDLYRWEGTELSFIESRAEDEKPTE